MAIINTPSSMTSFISYSLRVFIAGAILTAIYIIAKPFNNPVKINSLRETNSISSHLKASSTTPSVSTSFVQKPDLLKATSNSVSLNSNNSYNANSALQSNNSLVVNGQAIPLPTNGSLQKTLVSNNGQQQTNINVTTSSTSTTSSSSVNVSSHSSSGENNSIAKQSTQFYLNQTDQ